MLSYKNRNTFLQGLHPLTVTLIIITYLILFLKFKNPLYFVCVLASLLTIAYLDGCLKEVMGYAKIMMPFAVGIMILNPLLVHNGDTILYQGYLNIPVLGKIIITKEAILYGVFNGLRMVSITALFGFGNLIVHPDRTFGYFAKYIKRSSLLMSMTIRLFPTMMKSYENILEIEKLRCNSILKDGMKNKIKGSGNIANILFLSSLEDSEDMAESMYSRGYGVLNKRSYYFREKYTIWDFVIIVISVGVLIYMYYFTFSGFNEFNFYNKVDNVLLKTSREGIILCGGTYLIALINWWWKIWK